MISTGIETRSQQWVQAQPFHRLALCRLSMELSPPDHVRHRGEEALPIALLHAQHRCGLHAIVWIKASGQTQIHRRRRWSDAVRKSFISSLRIWARTMKWVLSRWGRSQGVSEIVMGESGTNVAGRATHVVRDGVLGVTRAR